MGNTEETAAEETLEREGASNAGRGDMEPAREVQAPDGCPSPLEIRPYDPSADPDADYGAILMPESKVEEFRFVGKDPAIMAQLFDVPVSAMRMRLGNLRRQ